MTKHPTPWTYSEYNDTVFIVRDANGRGLAYVYYAKDRQAIHDALMRDEAEQLAKWIVRSPDVYRASLKPAEPEQPGDGARGERDDKAGDKEQS